MLARTHELASLTGRSSVWPMTTLMIWGVLYKPAAISNPNARASRSICSVIWPSVLEILLDAPIINLTQRRACGGAEFESGLLPSIEAPGT